MTGETTTDALERQRYLVNEFAAQVVLAGDAEASCGESNWLVTLQKLADEAGREQTEIGEQVIKLQKELISLKEGSRPFFDAAETGIERLGEIFDALSGSSKEPEPSEGSFGIADDPELIADFIMESREHLRAIEQNVLAVEQDRTLMDPIHAMFRAFHTIKGIAGFLELQSIRDVSHETETLLDLARNGELALNPAVIDVILESADYLNREVSRIEAGGAECSAPAGKLIDRISRVAKTKEDQVQQDLKLISEVVAVADATAAAMNIEDEISAPAPSAPASAEP